MRDVRSNDRRRRLRLIKAAEEQSAKRFRSAISALTIASDTEATRIDVEVIRRQLLDECRANPSTLLRIEHPGAATMDVRFDRPYMMIGSDSGCDLRLEHDEVKSRHAFLQWIDGKPFFCDIAPRTNYFPDRHASANGQWVSDQPISIGPYQLSLVQDEANSTPDFSPLDRSQRLASEYPLLALQFEGVEQSNNVWPINRILTLIGRSSQCKLRLNHKSIAQVQACLLRTANGCWLIDLMNDGTTGINGRAIQVSPVDIGDVLQMGSFRVEVVTMAIPSSFTTVERTTTKPLPPLKFDRAPKAHSRQQIALAMVSSSDESSRPSTMTMDGAPPANSLPPIKFDRPPKSLPRPPTAVAVVESPAIKMPPNLETSEKSTIVNIQSSSEKPLPPIRLDRQPRQQPNQSPTLASSPESNAKSNLTAPSVNSAMDPPTVIAEFIAEQNLQLATLKERLENLKKIYDAATGQLISKKMRDLLEMPVFETMACHDFMKEALAKFVQSTERT